MHSMNLKWSIAVAVVVFTVFVKVLSSFNRWWYISKLKAGQAPLPPGTLGWPVFGNMGAFLRAFKSSNPDSFINYYIQRYNRAGLYKAFLFWQPTVIAATPETCKLVLTKDWLFETGWPTSTRKLIGTRSFAGLTGKEHLKLRKLTEPALNSPKALQQYIPLMVNNIKNFLEDMSSKEQVLLLTEMRKYAFFTIHDILFGKESTLDANEVSDLYHLVNQGVRALPINLPGTAYNKALKARKRLAMLLHKVIKERRLNKEVKTDTLSLLMDARDEGGNQIDDDQITDILIMYLNAGHESTAHLILWIIMMLHKYKSVYGRVKREQDVVSSEKKPGEVLTLSDVKKMSYLAKVIDETLRLANISPMVFRKATADAEVNGFTIPKGWHVEPWMRQVHMDPTVHNDPHKFDPDRWTRNEVRPFTHIPFGLGSRMCPGNELAKLEATIVVHHLVTGYELKPLNPDCAMVYLPHPRPKDLYPVKIRQRA